MASTIVTVLGSVAGLAYWLGRRLAAIETQLAGMEGEVRGLKDQVGHLEERIRKLELGMEGLRERVDGLEAKMAKLEEKVGRLEAGVSRLEERLTRLEGEVRHVGREVRGLRDTVSSMAQTLFSSLIDFMSLKGLFTSEEREYLLRDIRRLGELFTSTANPLRPEEAKFIIEVVEELKKKGSKDFDLRKLDKIIEIARRLIIEEPNRPEAFRLLFDAIALKAIVRKEKEEAAKKERLKFKPHPLYSSSTEGQ